MRLKAFNAIRPPPELAKHVASPPYDVVTTEEARAVAQGNPKCFLHVVRSEIDLPDGTDPHSDAVYAQAARAFADFQKEGWLVRDETPALYLYRQALGDHSQTGVVGLCHVGDYEIDVIRKHEKTRRDKEDDRTRHIESIGAHSGPVFLAYRDQPEINEIVSEVEVGAPFCDFVASDGVRHTVWQMAWSKALVDLFGGVPRAYIADGHHRAASAVRIARKHRDANPRHTGKEEYNWFLAVLFPAKQLRILPYNRCVKDLHGASPTKFLGALSKVMNITEGVGPEPRTAGQISMYLGRKWYGLSWEAAPDADPVTALDVSVLQDRVLAPLLGIADPRQDARIDFVGGKKGTAELMRLVDSGQAAVAFSMYPTGIDQLFAIADAGQTMPPKSTWFEPKLRSGLLVHTLD
ncbi:MAG: DUF1015 domain-containing protein [Kiritimatiellae bacterium]|nr:DUF1015 domain-containing protein [Kiritimatiellia bacterium]